MWKSLATIVLGDQFGNGKQACKCGNLLVELAVTPWGLLQVRWRMTGEQMKRHEKYAKIKNSIQSYRDIFINSIRIFLIYISISLYLYIMTTWEMIITVTIIITSHTFKLPYELHHELEKEISHYKMSEEKMQLQHKFPLQNHVYYFWQWISFTYAAISSQCI